MTLYTSIKFVHILLAIVAVGFNASYGMWLSRVSQQPATGAFILRGVKLLDDRFANPSYAFLLVTGVAMVFTGPWGFSMFWIQAAAILWLIAVLWGAFMFTPALRNQIKAIETLGFDSGEYQRLARRTSMVGGLNMVPILLILIMMVFKPTF